MICTNCGGETDVLLIDAMLTGAAREQKRWCFQCKPEARHEFAGYAPRMLARMDLPEEVRRAALAARRYVVDRSQSYPLAERLIDLAGPIIGGSN